MFALALAYHIWLTIFDTWVITMRECVEYINDSDMTLTFDHKRNFFNDMFMTWLCVRAAAFWSFDIVILCLARVCITIVQCVAYISDLYMYMILTFELNIKIIFSP